MIAWWWLLLALSAAFSFGFIVCAMIVNGADREDDDLAPSDWWQG